MAKDETKRLKPVQLESDRAAFAALQAITGYAPSNATFSLAAIRAAHAELAEAQTMETQAAAAAASARDNAAAMEWTFHNLMLGAKDQVVAQFGRDSNEVQAVGLKRVSEYRARKRQAKEKTA